MLRSLRNFMLGPVLRQLAANQEQTMAALDDLKAKIATLSAQVEDANGKADKLIELVSAPRMQIQALTYSGGATPEQLASLSELIDGVTQSVAKQAAENDAALTSGPVVES